MTLVPRPDATPLHIHVLDMGWEMYGDCILCVLGDRRILIDGGHRGDYDGGRGYPSIPDQLQRIIGAPPPYPIDLLVVTHCHSDHIGCLPTMVSNGDLNVRWALVADELWGFGRESYDAIPDSVSALDRLVAALREEDRSELDDADLERFLVDAGTLEQRYRSMLQSLESAGATVVRYGRDDHGGILAEFQDFGLQILGPTTEQLQLCADAIARLNQDAIDAMSNMVQADPFRGDTAIYRDMIAQVDSGLADVVDQPGKGAALNNQSVILKVSVGGFNALLTGDMQFARAEVTGLGALMTEHRDVVRQAGPYHFCKVSHHASYNALDAPVLGELGGVRALAISTGVNGLSHPHVDVLRLLDENRSTVRWARTDRNGHIDVSVRNGGPWLTVSRGRINDATPKSDVARVGGPRPLTPLETTTVTHRDGIVEISATAKIPVGVPRLTITFDMGSPAQGVWSTRDPRAQRHRGRIMESIADRRLARGRPLPPLLFVTHLGRLEKNLGREEAAQALQMIRNAGQTTHEVASPDNPFSEIRRQIQDRHRGVVILGGYDVLPAQPLDTLDEELRQTLEEERRRNPDSGNDPDNYTVWSDEAYGDRDGDGFAELPVSRIPDARSPELVFAALTGAGPSQDRLGVRNEARPFAEGVYKLMRGSRPLFVSQPTSPAELGVGGASGAALYFMLHGSDVDTSRFWGESDRGPFEAVNVTSIPKTCSGVVFTGCCYGALPVRLAAVNARRGQSVEIIPPESSIALSFLKAGVRAFVGCTGAHYSPPDEPFDYYGAPMHKAFWTRYNNGEPPAQALFNAKIDYLAGYPHGQDESDELAIEQKILRQFTCLGLGW